MEQLTPASPNIQRFSLKAHVAEKQAPQEWDGFVVSYPSINVLIPVRPSSQYICKFPTMILQHTTLIHIWTHE